MKDRFTRVLKGHIAIAWAVFPKGVTGAQIDAFARKPLWEAGPRLRPRHGPRHRQLSLRARGAAAHRQDRPHALEVGMMLSNEPGFYKPGAYGIRIENLILVEPRTIPGGDREMLGFETLTFTPIDLRLVEPSIMTADEIAWLNAYHAKVRELIGPGLDADTQGMAGTGDAGDRLTSSAVIPGRAAEPGIHNRCTVEDEAQTDPDPSSKRRGDGSPPARDDREPCDLPRRQGRLHRTSAAPPPTPPPRRRCEQGQPEGGDGRDGGGKRLRPPGRERRGGDHGHQHRGRNGVEGGLGAAGQHQAVRHEESGDARHVGDRRHGQDGQDSRGVEAHGRASSEAER
jgi:hypothetical protein